MYTYGKHNEIKITGTDNDYTYLEFIGVQIRISKDFKAERKDQWDRWKAISWHDNGTHQSRTSIYNGNVRKTLSRARVMCIVAHGLPPKDKNFVKHINGDTMDDRPDNLEWANDLTKSTSVFRTQENIDAISKIPSGQRNWHNPEYMKVYNALKGSDGMNHADRFRLKMKELGLVRRCRIVDGVKKQVWMPADTPHLKRGPKKSKE